MSSFLENYSNFVDSTVYSLTPPPPVRIMIEMTNMCNKKCVFCAHKYAVRPTCFMDMGLCERVLSRSYDLGARECAFHGGAEPFLHSRLPDAVRIAKKIGYQYTYLSTNGTAGSKKMLYSVLEAGLDSIKFSINAATDDDYTAVHGSSGFKQALDMLDAAYHWKIRHNSQIKIYISCIRCKENESNLPELKKIVGDKIDDIEILNSVWLGMPTDIPLSSLQQKYTKGERCCEVFNRFTVTSEGLIRGCCSDFNNMLVLGDAKKGDLLEIWHGEPYRKLRQAHLDDSLPSHCLCNNCKNFVNDPLLPFSSLY